MIVIEYQVSLLSLLSPPLKRRKYPSNVRISTVHGNTQWCLPVMCFGMAINPRHIQESPNDLILALKESATGYVEGRLAPMVPRVHFDALSLDQPLGDVEKDGLRYRHMQRCLPADVGALRVEACINEHVGDLDVILDDGRVERSCGGGHYAPGHV